MAGAVKNLRRQDPILVGPSKNGSGLSKGMGHPSSWRGKIPAIQLSHTLESPSYLDPCAAFFRST